MKILVVEDEIKLQETIVEFLEKEKMIVESADNYKQALDKIISFDYDCILLDMMLPDGDGMSLLKELKKLQKETSVIILSAKDSVDDKVEGLLVGADDYLAKPFHFAELLARIKVAFRKKLQKGEDILTYKNIRIYPEDRLVKVNEVELKLNRKEYDLLYYFMLRPERVFQKTTLAESVWGDHIEMSDNLDFIYSQIKNLRKKLKEANSEADLQAVYGIGYKLI
ncbi:response regulator transcription factor [Empedobacter falsenii]|uniref:Response regulator transcription factor n=1 Tax=Empedobacter falsenii TaxID=343874 RepID=A0ABY8V4X3_9FLAO|nr:MULTISPECIES: response regulator transcription factor [Empedobacter]MCA4810452.1 response regulator transcription factor [Empedobacter stercoris]MDM1524040.1 response regulator transcription factor [Empedobacter sp. 225-1]MDM1543990.1 response regulator transcription factor [Empedobacter sp. 189-2]QNT14934.1 response regulator transcription factor [Empedobacter stercoris]WIH96721.1 response regulator transcription factor [Empedobacter falsenii]